MSTPRTYDLIAWGATGFTGKLVAKELCDSVGAGDSARLRWAIAGRSREKLEAVRDALATTYPEAESIPIVIADSADEQSLRALTASTRVVLSTVGPFAKYGTPLVAACVAEGTDYCDVTGEGPWVREMLDTYGDQAARNRLRIVSLCGYDSVPSDLLCRLLQDELIARSGSPASVVEGLVGPIKGSFSGGTIATMINIMRMAKKDKSLAKKLHDPLVFAPHRSRTRTVPLTKKNRPNPLWPRKIRGRKTKGWTGPFIMGAINGSVVHRTNDLLNQAWGDDFVYRESTWCGRGRSGWMTALGTFLMTAALGGGLMFPPTRLLMQMTILPKPGQGPSASTRAKGYFRQRAVDLVTGTTALMEARFDPGYEATAKMLVACGRCLVEDREKLPNMYGVITPGAVFGPLLVPRLQDRGFTITVR